MIQASTIDDAAEFIRGITFKPDQLVELNNESSVVCMRTKNVQKDLDESDLIAVPRELVRHEKKLLREGDILLSTANSWELVGKCSYVSKLDYPATAGGFISIVRPRSAKAHPRFLYHWLNSPQMQFTLRHLGRQTTNISNMDVGRFKQLAFPKIDYEEQRRIAGILDQADAIRRKREQALDLTDDFLKSTFLEMFGNPATNNRGWHKGLVGDCLTKVVGGWSAKGDARAAEPDEMGVLKISAVTSGEYLPNKNKVVSRIPGGKRVVIPKEGNLLFSRANTRELVAATCIVTEAQPNVFLPDKLWRLDPKPEVAEAVYLKYVLTHPEYREMLCSRATGTSGSMLNISKAKLLSHPIPIPNLEIQREFLTIWRTVQLTNRRCRDAGRMSEQLLGSLSQYAFRGEL